MEPMKKYMSNLIHSLNKYLLIATANSLTGMSYFVSYFSASVSSRVSL